MAPRRTYKWKTRPYVHQVLAVKKLLSTGWGGALLMAPRTGKTKTFIDYASILYTAGKINRVLIFCPVSVLGVWEEEFKVHCPVPYRLLVWDRESRQYKKLPKFGSDHLDIVVLNYDALSSPGTPYINKQGYRVRSKTRGGRFDVMKRLVEWQPHLICLDESHRIKTPTARKTKMIVRLGPVADYRVIMTGTVVTKKKRLFDIWAQWEFLNPDLFDMDFSEFKARYGKWIQRHGYVQWIKNMHEDELHNLIHDDSFAITREECFDLPERLPPDIIRVPLVESAAAYDEMAREMVHRIQTGEITEASIQLVQILRLAQICSGVAKTNPTKEYPDGRLYRLGREKLNVVEDLLVDLFEGGEKVVIGARFISDILGVEEMCKRLKIKCYTLYGAIPRKQRDTNIRNFREWTSTGAVFVMQPQAGSLGIDLSTAGTFIWMSLTPSYVDYTQAEDRIALNQDVKGTRFIYVLGQDTVDEVLYNVLQEDGDVAKAIMASPESLLRFRTR